jgi:hypothetical protein
MMGLAASVRHEGRSNVFNPKCPFAQHRPAARVLAGELGTSCSDSRRRHTIPVSPPKVDHLGCPTVCWETEL